jgi:hypothetical protein
LIDLNIVNIFGNKSSKQFRCSLTESWIEKIRNIYIRIS